MAGAASLPDLLVVAVGVKRWTQHKGDKLWERCGRRPQHPVVHPQPRLSPGGYTHPHFSRGCPGKSCHPHAVCSPVHPSSTPVSLRQHFAVCGLPTCLTTSLAGFLYGPHLVEETQTRLKIPGATLPRKCPGLEAASRGCESRTPGGDDPTQPATRPFSRRPSHEQGCPLRKWKATSTPHSHRCRRRPGIPA